MYKSASVWSVGALCPGASVGGWVCMCVRESRLASDDKPHRIANHPTQPASSLDPCAAPGGPSVLAWRATLLHAQASRPAGQAGSTRRRRQQEPGNGAKGEMRGSWAGRPFMCASQRASVQREQRKANLAGPAATVEKSMYCTVRCVQASGAIWTSHVPLPRPHEITHQILDRRDGTYRPQG